MTTLDDIAQEPWRFDFFDTLRRIERASGGAQPKPRIGDSATRRDEHVFLGQNPYLDFPASNLSKFEKTGADQFTIFVKFLGLLGPMGALPLATTEEAHGWSLSNDDAFPRFLDLFNNRFLQLFFRAWADARPIAQSDRPDEDRFIAYIGSAIGVGSDPYRHRDSIPDSGKLSFAGILGAKAKSASRLRGALQGLFGTKVAIEQFVGSRLELPPSDRTLIGGGLSTLGVDTMLGSAFYSVQDKIRVRIYVADMDHYKRFLPDGDLCEKLVDLVYFFLGDELDWDVELAVPAAKVTGTALGASARLGWTSWLSPDGDDDGYRTDARFHAAERMRHKRNSATVAVA